MEESNQAFPANHRAEVLAFMKAYLNNPVGVREAVMAEPTQRTVNGRARYVGCLRFAERQADGTYRDPRERAILFVNGRLDRVLQESSEVCAGVVVTGPASAGSVMVKVDPRPSSLSTSNAMSK